MFRTVPSVFATVIACSTSVPVAFPHVPDVFRSGSALVARGTTDGAQALALAGSVKFACRAGYGSLPLVWTSTIHVTNTAMARLATTVDTSVEAEFLIRARQANIGKHDLLREIVYAYLVQPRQYLDLIPESRSADTEHLSVRLFTFLADAVRQRAADKGMSASRWKAALIQSHLMREPVLDDGEIEVLRESNNELRMIGRNLNQIARALNARPEETERIKLEVIKALVQLIDIHQSKVRSLIQHSQKEWGIE